VIKRRSMMKKKSLSVAASSSSRYTESRELLWLTRQPPKKKGRARKKCKKRYPKSHLVAARADLTSLRWYTDVRMKSSRNKRGKKRFKRVTKTARRKRVAKVIRTNKMEQKRMGIIEERERERRTMKHPNLTVLMKNSVPVTGDTRNEKR
jgi:hypothetical protein